MTHLDTILKSKLSPDSKQLQELGIKMGQLYTDMADGASLYQKHIYKNGDVYSETFVDGLVNFTIQKTEHDL